MVPSKLAAARRMRRAPAATERFLWKLLRNRKLEQLKFRRQVPIGRFIADFVCLRHRLIVEADGYWHDPEADARRDDWLRGQGFRVLRFANNDIVGRGEVVLAAIVAAAMEGVAVTDEYQFDQWAHAQSPSPLAGEGGPGGLG